MNSHPVKIVYLPVNQAYLVMWHEQRLAGPMTMNDAKLWCRSVYGHDIVVEGEM